MLRVAFIGAGQMASHHVSALRRLAVPAALVGVYDRVAGRAAEFGALADCRAFPSLETLLGDAQPDIVHVCTPPGAHFDAASAALAGGAHVYVEKPFALTLGHARSLLDMAHARRRLVCAGHQLLRDRAFDALLAGAAGLGTPVQVDSDFAFRPMGVSPGGAATSTLARHLVDILPHPLYTLVSVLERLSAPGERIDLAWVHAEPADLQAILRVGTVLGRLSVSLRARPVASSIALKGTQGSLTCDFVHSIVTGSRNPGTEALEKVLNPMIEGAQLVARTAMSLGARVRSNASYPGLTEFMDAFYRAVATGGPSPVSPAHLLSVTEVFEKLVARIDAVAQRSGRARAGGQARHARRLAVVTGARGFLGAKISRALSGVRGIGRGGWPDDPHVQEWVVADLSQQLTPTALADTDVVVHAAAETSGGYAAHQRNTIDGTRNLLRAMHAAGVSRLVLVSSLSVLRPPKTPWERQDERTPRPSNPRPLGPYTWGKCLQEALVEQEAASLGIAVRIVRPGALIDWRAPELPGLMGRRLFGRWHLGLGRPGLPIAVCDVERCADAIAWCAGNFAAAPPVVNLFDPLIVTRGDLIARLRDHGWTGRILWVPIGLVASGLAVARTVLSLLHGRLPERLATWSILQPRRYDRRVAAALFASARRGDGHPHPEGEGAAAAIPALAGPWTSWPS